MIPSEQIDLSDMSILIVEDVETSNRFYEAALKGTRAKLLWAMNGKDALEVYDAHKEIDIILLDLNLPDINGFEVMKYIRKENPKVKIIVQTAYVFSGEEEKSYKLGADFFVSKPVRFDALLAAIRKVLA